MSRKLCNSSCAPKPPSGRFRLHSAARGGGGGGGGGAARDLAALFDLELDTEKNQYETQKSAAGTAEQKAQEIADALKKLDELAKREEDLAQQQRNGAADCRGEMAAGDVAAGGAATPAADGAAAGSKWPAGPATRAATRPADKANRAARAVLQVLDNPADRRAVHPPAAAPGRAIPNNSPRTRPPTAANRPLNRRSTACARLTKT